MSVPTTDPRMQHTVSPTEEELAVLRRMFPGKSTDEIRATFHATHNASLDEHTEVQRVEPPAALTSPEAETEPQPPSLAPASFRRTMTRAEVLDIRRKERENGVDFPLVKTGLVATVRDLPLSDRIMLTGIPTELRSSVSTLMGFADAEREDSESVITFEQAIAMLEKTEEVTNAMCIAGFIYPRLVNSEAELDGTADCWLVTDLHIDERTKYREFVMRDRGSQSEVARLATFPGATVEEASTR